MPSLKIFNHLSYHQSPKWNVEGEHVLPSNKPSEGLEAAGLRFYVAFIRFNNTCWVPLSDKHQAHQKR